MKITAEEIDRFIRAVLEIKGVPPQDAKIEQQTPSILYVDEDDGFDHVVGQALRTAHQQDVLRAGGIPVE